MSTYSDIIMKIRKISAVDTIHDFYNELKDNTLYKNYISEIMNPYIKDFKKSSIEHDVLQYLGHKDSDVAEYNSTTFIQDYKADPNNNPFAILVDNINDPDGHFKTLLASICATKSNNNHFITDINMLKEDIICKMQVIKDNKPIRGAFVISEATYYDSGTNKKIDGICYISSNIDAELINRNGNLFGLDRIAVGTNDDKEYLTYNYNNQSKNILIKDFIKEQKIATTITDDNDNNNRNRNFFIKVMSLISQEYKNKRQKTGGAGKRKSSESELDQLFDILDSVYKLEYDYDTLYTDKDALYKFMSILFDFKRAGDQLQVMSALANDNIMITNDRMTTAYASLLKIPVIKTSAIGVKEEANKPRVRRLVFYNFNSEQIVKKVLNKEDYYYNNLNFSIDQFESFMNNCAKIRKIIIDNIINKDDLIIKLDNSIKKSVAILNLKLKTNDNEILIITRNVFNKKGNVYLYHYALQYNILICILLKYFIETSFLDDFINSDKFIRANKNTIEFYKDQQDKLKNIFGMFQKHINTKMMNFMSFSDGNIELLEETIKYYNSIQIDDYFYNPNVDTKYKVNIINYGTLGTKKTQGIQKSIKTQNTYVNNKLTNERFNNIIEHIINIPKKSKYVSIPIINYYINIFKMKWGNKTISLENNKSGEKYKSNYIILPNMDLQKHHNKIIESINNNYNTIRTLSYKMILNQKIRSGLSKISPIKSIYAGGNNDIDESIIYNIINDIEKEQITYYDMFISNLKLKLNEINDTEDELVRDLYQIIIMFLIKQFKIFDEYGNISEKYRYEILDTSIPMSISPNKIRNMTLIKTPNMTPDKTPNMTPDKTRNKTPNMTPDKTRNKTRNKTPNLTTNKSYINKKLVFPENIENMNVIEEKIDVSERPSRSMKTKKSIGSIQSNVSTKSKKM